MKSLVESLVESLNGNIMESAYPAIVKKVIKDFKKTFGWDLVETSDDQTIWSTRDSEEIPSYEFFTKDQIAQHKDEYFVIVIWEDGKISFSSDSVSIDPLHKVYSEEKELYFTPGEIFANAREVKDNLIDVIEGPYSEEEYDLDSLGWKMLR